MAQRRTVPVHIVAPWLGLLIAGVLFLISYATPIIERLELRVLDIHFNLRNDVQRSSLQEGVTQVARNYRISPDILIVGIDFNTLNRFGKWPFPRWRHADLIDTFSRISDQTQRERALFIDFFFIEPASNAYEDIRLAESIARNDRLFLETIIQSTPPPVGTEDELFARHDVLFDRLGTIENITGDWSALPLNLGLEPPLIPFAERARGFGHANFYQDDDEVFRRQPMIIKLSRLVEEIRLDEFTLDLEIEADNFERLSWFDKQGIEHTIPYPLDTATLEEIRAAIVANAPLRYVDDDNDGEYDDAYHVIRRFQDQFVPAVTLSLALQYFNKTYADIEVVLGEYIRIPDPQYFNVAQNRWEPYRVLVRPERADRQGNIVAEARYRTLPEITIPIDETASMLINFMGGRSSTSIEGYQTYSVRSYAGYASRTPSSDPKEWPETRAVPNRIVMVGAFASGLADDEKTTPYGLMYGIEMHANALNTIIMDNFIHNPPLWLNIAILVTVALITALMTARLPVLWASIAASCELFAFFFTTTVLFDRQNMLLNFSMPALSIIAIFLTILMYRLFGEEREKRHIRDTFGRYVSPRVVDQILAKPPELGGIDKEISVFFSDIRGFTSLSETMSPQQLVQQLNVYFTTMTDIIFDYQGTLDKYVGDEIMCFWGAPLPQRDHALRACNCALMQIEALKRLNDAWPEERRINIGIGINSGIMTVGNVGSPGRLNYTLMGDNVNLGARLEGTNKQYRTNIIIGEYTYRLVQHDVIVRELDIIRVKGKVQPVVIYELVATKE